MKRCSECGEVKPHSEFYLDRRKPGRYRSKCKPCHTAVALATRDVEARKAYMKKYNAAVDHTTQKVRDARNVSNARHPQVNRDRVKRWRKANPEAHRAADARRKSRSKISPEDAVISVAYRCAIANDPCFYCGGAGEQDDHYFAIAKGGTDIWYNLVRACAACNNHKRTRCGTFFLLKL